MLLSEKATGQGAHGMENMLKERRLILASGSPRRIEMLTACGLKPQVVPSQYEETLPFPMPPEEMVMFFAMGALLFLRSFSIDIPLPPVSRLRTGIRWRGRGGRAVLPC